MKIKFCGAARTVTGSCHLIELQSGFTFLLDCGLFQGRMSYIDSWNQHFGFNPSSIDVLILSHAHIDHCGRIPKLVKEGFKGKIYCTSATADLIEIMLMDTAHIQEKDAEYHNKKRKAKNETIIPPLYTTKDVPPVLSHLREVDYDSWFKISDELSFRFKDAGHIMGSASVNLKIKENGKEINVGFSGDIGRPSRPILRDPVTMDDMDYLICESTYGNRIHEGSPDDKMHLLKIITDTCINKKGKIVIPAFSLGRTQEIVYMMDQLSSQHQLPKVKVYVDSPLSLNVTDIYRKHQECFDDDINEYLRTDSNPFGFNDLKFITSVEESIALNDSKEPCIIISASGMAEAGRVVHHIRNTVKDENNTILIVGYCTQGSLGQRLRKKPEYIKILGNEYPLKASIEIMDSFSAHADKNELIQFLDPLDRERIKNLILVHGDYEDAQLPFKKILEDLHYKNVLIPDYLEEIII
jgi:metallo-beta-lactamase family protein